MQVRVFAKSFRYYPDNIFPNITGKAHRKISAEQKEDVIKPAIEIYKNTC